MRQGIIAVCILTLASCASSLRVGSHDELSTRLQNVLDGARAQYAFPGASAAVVLPDGTIVTAVTGFADLENERAMTPETPMLAASVGKTFVAAAVLSLESEDVLSRSDLVSVYLGDHPWFDALPNAGTMTVGQLLQHTSGLPDHVHLPAFQQAWSGLATGDGDIDPDHLVAFVAGEAPLFGAGTGWAYSDTGYVLLGLVIEEVTDRPWQEAVVTRFLEPLGLTGTIPSDRPDLPGLAVGYVAPDNLFGMPERTANAEGRLLWNPAVESAGGGFASTSADLARWGHLLFGGDAMDALYLDRLLDGVPVDPDTPGIFYGAGVAIYAETPRGPVYGHGGWIPAYVSSLRHYADHGVTVAFQINTDIGIVDDTTDLVPNLEAALADLAISTAR